MSTGNPVSADDVRTALVAIGSELGRCRPRQFTTATLPSAASCTGEVVVDTTLSTLRISDGMSWQFFKVYPS